MPAIPLLHVEPRSAAVACTLAPGRYEARTAGLAALASEALRSREAIPGGARLVFADQPGVERELRAAVAAEAACCSFLRMDLARTADGLVLDVAGPASAARLIAELFASASPGAAAQGSSMRR